MGNEKTLLNELRQRLDQSELTLLRGSIGSFLVNILGAGLALILQVTLARVLGVESFGAYTYVWNWISVAVLIGNLGFTTASVRFVAEFLSRRQWKRLNGYLHYSRRIVLSVSIVVALVFAGLATMLIASEQRELLHGFLVGAVAIPILTRIRVGKAELRGFKRVVSAEVPEQIFFRSGFIASLVFLAWGLGVNFNAVGALATSILISGMALGILVRLTHQAIPDSMVQVRNEKVLRGRKWKWIITARDMLLISGFNLILFRADVIMVGALIDPTASGLYNVASKIASVLVFALAAVNSILSPIAADLHTQGDYERLQGIVVKAARSVFIFSIFMAACIFAFQNQLLSLFGRDFVHASGALWPLLMGQVINSFAGPAILLLNMTGQQDLSAKILGVSALINLALNAILIPLFGFQGAAIATMVTMIIWNGFAVLGVRHRLNLGSTALF